MKKLLLLSFVFVWSFLSAQQTQTTPAVPTNAGLNYGDIIEIVMTNTTGHPITLTPLLNWPGHEEILTSNQSFYNYVSDSGNAGFIQAIDNIVHVIKGPLHTNSKVVFDPWNSLHQTTLACSPVLSNHSLYDGNCGLFAQQLARPLVHIGYVDTANIKTVKLTSVDSSNHIVAQIFDSGHGIKVDPDPGQPGYLQTYANSTNGFASCADIQADPSILTERYYYKMANGDSINLCPGNSLQEYGNYYANVQEGDFKWLNEEMANVSGDWKIAPYQTVKFQFSIDDKFFFNPSAVDSAQMAGMMQLYQLAQAGNENALDSIAEFIAGHTYGSYPPSVVKDRLAANQVTIDNMGDYFDDYLTKSQSSDGSPVRSAYLDVTIPASASAQIIGQDVSLPFFLHSVDCSGGAITFDATGTTVTNATYSLYDTTAFNNPTRHSPILADSQVQTLATPGIIPAGTTVNASVYYNPAFYNFFNGVKFKYSGTDSLAIATNVVKAYPPAVPTAIAELQDEGIKVFPNPAADGYLNIQTNMLIGQIDVYDLTGKRLLNQVGGNTVKVDQLSAGTYIIKVNDYRQTFIVQ